MTHEQPHRAQRSILDERLLTTREVADLLRLSRASVTKLIKRGELVASRTPGGFRTSNTAVETYLERCEVKTPRHAATDWAAFTLPREA